MKNEVLFFESQRFRQVWLWVLIAFSNATLLYFIFQQVRTDFQILDHHKATKNLVALIIPVLICVATTIFMFLIRLDTMIKADGVYVKFFPIHQEYRKFTWNQLFEVKVRKYSPLAEYGGWGYRLTLKKGKAYTISGNYGIQLVTSDNSRLLIGTRKPDEVTKILTNNYLK